jgi:hypothetical protein
MISGDDATNLESHRNDGEIALFRLREQEAAGDGTSRFDIQRPEAGATIASNVLWTQG